ncbi:transposase [Limosilactobacillus allomucosae]|uniref:transposase n=1 Tax=Limosilactobacillus allomucosae TaxID=3142938 RepID=UPI0032649B35
MEQVAARFDVRPTQVSSWKNIAQRYGNEALASQKEKAAKTMEHKQKETQQLTKEDRNKHEMAAEIARLRAELDKTKKELYYARMDRDIAKKVQALVKASASKPKRK